MHCCLQDAVFDPVWVAAVQFHGALSPSLQSNPNNNFSTKTTTQQDAKAERAAHRHTADGELQTRFGGLGNGLLGGFAFAAAAHGCWVLVCLICC